MSIAPSPTLPTAFNRLALSNLAAQSAEQIGLAAAPLIAVVALGAGAGATGLLQAVLTLPFLLLSFPAGVLADRGSRRRLMAGAEAVRALAFLAIPVLAAFGLLSLPMLAMLGFLGATGTVAYSVAAPALIPALVPRADLARANGRIELARSLAAAAGPALAGLLVAWAGGDVAFALAAGLSVAAVMLLAGLVEPARPALPPRRFRADIAEGARFVFGHTLLRPILLTAVFFNTAFFVLHGVYVPYAVRDLGLSAGAVGATLACYGIGMVVGALAAPRLARALPFGTVVAIGPICGVLAAVTMALTIWVPDPTLAAAAFFLFGAGPLVWTISTTTLRQTVTPEAMIGRTSAVLMTATFGARPIGAAIGAGVGAALGAPAAILVALICFAVQAAIILASPVPRLARLPDGPAPVRA